MSTRNLDRAVTILNDDGSDALIERVVLAAARALDALEHGETTPDGDSTAMTARSILRTAFMDLTGIEGELRKPPPAKAPRP